MSQLKATCSRDFSDEVLPVEPWNPDASLDLLLPPGLGGGAEDQCIHHDHRFVLERHWQRGRQGLMCGGLC